MVHWMAFFIRLFCQKFITFALHYKGENLPLALSVKK